MNTSRKIPTQPEIILDAVEIIDNLSSNLLEVFIPRTAVALGDISIARAQLLFARSEERMGA